jgi:cell wall assembly regulator SMI1
MEEIWKKIDSWLKVNAPKVFNTLQPGASESQIQAVENALSIQFPEDVRASYRIHNGQLGSDYGLIPEAQEFLSLERIQQEWQGWKRFLDEAGSLEDESEPDPGIRADWWNVKWIPFTYEGTSDCYCFDLHPAEGGNIGQIIRMIHDEACRELLAPNFQSWLEEYAAKLESGEYVFSEKYLGNQGIMSLETLED